MAPTTMNDDSPVEVPPEYYVLKDGAITGPFSEEDLKAAVEAGELAATDFVQTGGVPIWQPLHAALAEKGRLSHAAIAPDWWMIRDWALRRLKADVDEGSLRPGVACLVAGVVLFFLVSFLPSLLWVACFAGALAFAYQLLKRGRTKAAMGLFGAVAILPFVMMLVGSRGKVGTEREQSESLIASSERPEAAAPTRVVPEPPIPPESNLAQNSAPAPEAARSEVPPIPVAPPPVADSLPAAQPPILAATREAAAQPVASKPGSDEASTAEASQTVAQKVGGFFGKLFGSSTATPESATPAIAPVNVPPIPIEDPLKGVTVAVAPQSSGSVLAQKYRDALIIIQGKDGAGSGFVCRDQGRDVLFTNIHVVAGVSGAKLTSMDGKALSPGAAEMAVAHDIMKVNLQESPGKALEIATDLIGTVKIGDRVTVLGNSGGGGVVTNLEGKLVGIGPDRIEVTADFVPGNSGSPIIHLPTGKVIGIATYLTKKYDEFDSRGEVVRRFGYRIDSVKKWESVNWAAFRADAEQMKKISQLTADVFNFLAAIRGRNEPQFATETLRRPAAIWFEALRRPRVSVADRVNATQSFLSTLRQMVRGDVAAAEAQLRYSFFRDELKQEREVRDRLYKAFDSEIQRMNSPTTRGY